MLNGDGNENRQQKISVGLISKKTKTLQPRAAHFFLQISLPLFCKTTARNFQKLVCSCSLCFFRRRLFSPWWQLQLAFPLFLTAAIKFLMFFVQRYWSPLVFISRSNSSSVIHVNVGIEIKLKERSGFHCYCFYL